MKRWLFCTRLLHFGFRLSTCKVRTVPYVLAWRGDAVISAARCPTRVNRLHYITRHVVNTRQLVTRPNRVGHIALMCRKETIQTNKKVVSFVTGLEFRPPIVMYGLVKLKIIQVGREYFYFRLLSLVRVWRQKTFVLHHAYRLISIYEIFHDWYVHI